MLQFIILIYIKCYRILIIFKTIDKVIKIFGAVLFRQAKYRYVYYQYNED